MTEIAPIAYFCAEFGLDSALPLYAGGLGILAGDTLKQAATDQVPMVGVGLLYRGEGAVQSITPDGQQQESDLKFDPVAAGLEHVYQDELPVFIKVHLTEIDVWLRCWKKTLSPEVTVYFLDSDTEQNQLSERSLTHLLYSGTEESVIKQQFLLGIGGVKLLQRLNIHPSIYHVQEGRPAFLHWQLIRNFMDDHGLSFVQARDLARSKTVYTNHTLVGAGNPSYDLALIGRYARYYADKMQVSTDTLLEPGVEDDPTRFFMTRFALNTSRRASGVSQLHTSLSKTSWPNYDWVNVTNGVHFGTWQRPDIAATVSQPDQLWSTHLAKKRQTMEYIQHRTGYGYDPNRLVITWARRLAGYKRVGALFEDIARLRHILTNVHQPVQLLLAGKAHHLDVNGKQQLQTIIHYLQDQVAGSALFIPNYDIELAQQLVAGSDIWLNTPEKGKEACGTSGMKALSNGVLNVTVADGWAAEVNWDGLGWTLDSDQIADSVYNVLEHQVIPTFYEQSAPGYSHTWVNMMQQSIALAPQFSAGRMLKGYQEWLYSE